jgi:beta-lactamase class A
MKFFTKKVPNYFLIIALILGAFVSYAFTKNQHSNGDEETLPTTTTVNNFSSLCNININRLAGRKFIKPLLYAEKTCEAEVFTSLKGSINNIIGELKSKGEMNTASVYVRLFGKAEWLSINEETKYQPGSLFKVPLLITYLRLEEKTPGVLQKKLMFSNITAEAKQFKQEFMKNQIQQGQSYTVKELLKYMIMHSDNNATMLLFNNIPTSEFEKTFTDLGLDKNMTKSEGVVSAKEYSRFWIILYNGSYLNFDNSEYALSLLSQSDFDQGMMKGIPKNIMVAHKFGEKGNTTSHCLHETGIVYAGTIPYLVTIMTEGNNQSTLADCLQKISGTIYSNIESFTK